MTQEELNEAVEDAHRHNLQVGIHANGDVTIDMVLKAYERVLQKWPDPDRRHRIEHCTLVNPDLLRRIKASGVIPTPFWTYVYYHGEKWTAYGDEKMDWMFAHRSFLDAGIRVPGASDYTPGPFEPLMAIQSMVTRKDYRGPCLGGEPEDHRRRGAARSPRSTARTPRTKRRSKDRSRPASSRDFVILGRDPQQPSRIN